MADSDPELPTYSNAQAAQRAHMELRQNFVTLTDDQLDIQELFKRIAAELESMPEFGMGHALCQEWNELRKRHRGIYRDSQQNAGLCAHFLKNFAEILVPLSQSKDMSLEQKRAMITRFLKSIPAHMNTSKAHAEKFHELSEDIEVFPRKIASALRIKAEPVGFFESVWTGIEELCMTTWRTLHRLLTKMIYTFKVALARLEKLHFSRFGIYMDVYRHPYRSLKPGAVTDGDEHELTTRNRMGEIQNHCDALATKVAAFESAWLVVHLAGLKLSSDLASAKSFLTDPPISEACDENLRVAGWTHTPLVQCLNAYAMGKAPEIS